NGDWYPWSAVMGRNSPSDFVRMWKRVKDIVDARGIGSTRVQWVWAVNHDDVGGFRAEQYFPGDDSVDWVGIDGFNWGESQSWSFWRSPSASYDAILGRLRTLTTKPVGVVELATSSSTSSGDSVAAKSQWITDFFKYVIAKDIRMVGWFNEDKETDWAVLGGGNGDDVYREGEVTYNVYSTYRRAVGGSDFVASNPKNARLLTDEQFAGR
ncbi:MAG TPA: glycosyl hydrolase, partial [Herpetosiphonaceae bacterium]|nr:glycosyl hydrolase [Herpetosiphonaceae bacterium]